MFLFIIIDNNLLVYNLIAYFIVIVESVLLFFFIVLLINLGTIIANFFNNNASQLISYGLRSMYIYIFNISRILSYLGPLVIYITAWFKYLYLFMVIEVYLFIYSWIRSIYVYVDTLFYNLLQISYYTYLHLFYTYVCIMSSNYITYFNILLSYYYTFIRLYIYIMYILIFITNVS